MKINQVGRSLAAAGIASVMAISLAACGGSSSGDSSGGKVDKAGLAAAKSSVEKHVKPPTEIGPTVPIGKAIPKGKLLVYVNCGAVACTNQGKGLESAAKVLGWTVKTVQAQPTPESIQSAMDEAIRLKPDAVVSAGLSAAQYPKQLAKLTAMKVPIITSTGLEPTGVGGTTFNAQPPAEVNVATSLLADKTIVDMKGEGEIGVVYLTGYPLPKIYTDAYVARVQKICPGCTTKSINIQPTSIGKDAPQKLANFLRANPKISHIMLSYDALGLGLPTAVKGAGVSMPKVYSYSPDASGIQALQDGTETAATPQPYSEIGWQWADALARIYTGGKVADSQHFPAWVLWGKEYNNLPKTTDNPVIVQGYQQQYEKLWGITPN
jgi:ABC-type sugar transport system substrate-binding protein